MSDLDAQLREHLLPVGGWAATDLRRAAVLCPIVRVEGQEQLLLGLEQSGRTVLPHVHTFDLFKPMVEDALPELDLPVQRFVAHPRAATPTAQLAALRGPFTLALGPDGGFVDYEVDKLQAAGFHPISMGPHALRTETALAALWGQLALLRGD